MPYKKRLMPKKGFFKKNDYIYDEYYGCYICLANKILNYATTNREGYKEYKSNWKYCINCEFKSWCTESKNHRKLVVLYVWEEYIEKVKEVTFLRLKL